MDIHTEEHPSITWEVDESIAELSEQLIWSIGVRCRQLWELDTFLKVVKEFGTCTVVIEDPNGEVFYYPCHLSMRDPALSNAT